MKNYLPKILIGLALIGGFALSANSALAAPASVIRVQPSCGSDISTGPLFNEANFLPGDSKTCWVGVTNVSQDKTEKVAIEARKFDGTFPASDLAWALMIEIKSNGAILYGPKPLIDFYKDSGDPLIEDNKEVYLSDLAPGETRRYDITISFPTDKGNEWKGRTTSFDIVWGFQIIEQKTTEDNSDIYTSLDFGGGGFGGYYDENGAKVAGESVSREETGQTGGQTGSGGGFVAAAETGPAESISPTPTAPAVAGESTCLPIPWWPFGYVLLLIILGVAQKIEKRVSVGGIVLQTVLLIAALLWWWLEPCGARFWVWPVLILIVFLVSLRFYLKKSSSDEEISA